MGIRQWLWDRLASGPQPDLDPDELVEAAEVPLVQGPMLVSALRAAGIDAQGIEAFSIVTDTRSNMRIVVRRSDLDATHEILEAQR